MGTSNPHSASSSASSISSIPSLSAALAVSPALAPTASAHDSPGSRGRPAAQPAGINPVAGRSPAAILHTSHNQPGWSLDSVSHSLTHLHRRRLTGPSNQLGTPPRRQITGKLTLPHSWDFHPAVTGQLARSHSRQKENCTPFHRPSGRKHRQGNRKAGYSNHRPPIQPKERGRNKS